MITTNSLIQGKGLFALDTYIVEVFDMAGDTEYDATRTAKRWFTRSYALQVALFHSLECACIDDINKQMIADKQAKHDKVMAHYVGK